MKITGEIQIDVNPFDIIKELYEKETDYGKNKVYFKDGLYFLSQARWEEDQDISEELFDYIKALETLYNYLKKKKC